MKSIQRLLSERTGSDGCEGRDALELTAAVT